ncbi:MAG: hypothetical protein HY764_03590 [Candidatus Portnoybacteria bacterium]|nr:hypothetical protein [Candidatus Portnoybacteria bacterium]
MTFFENFKIAIQFIADLGWLWLPPVLAIAFFYSWMYYIQRVYWQGIAWTNLEIKPPREIDRTPKIMEQVFAGCWGIFGTVATKYQKYVKGIIQDYLVAEIVCIGGEIHFFLRIPTKFRNFIESQIYSQYPQAEIREVDDYVWNVPPDVPNKNWDLWGAKLKLAKDEVYPIRTYAQQLDVITPADSPSFIDPLSTLMEVMGRLQPQEQIWIQMLFRPIADDWVEKVKPVVEDIMGKAKPTTAAEAAPITIAMLSPGQREILTLLEQKASKKAYQAKVQFTYLGRREIFSMANVGATFGYFNQFASLNTNSLRPDPLLITKANYLFAKQRKIYRQRKLFRFMRQRSFWDKGYILNIEELASLFHFPTTAVKAPMTPWLETKKAEPPIGLPTT